MIDEGRARDLPKARLSQSCDALRKWTSFRRHQILRFGRSRRQLELPDLWLSRLEAEVVKHASRLLCTCIRVEVGEALDRVCVRGSLGLSGKDWPCTLARVRPRDRRRFLAEALAWNASLVVRRLSQ